VWVTAYCPECRVCDTTDTTATGTSADTPGAAVAARGPRAIPLGGRVYVANFGWLPIDDTGGGVDSDQIDVRMQSHRAARLWGRRLMRVRVETAGG
jgi:3D (Asp-Asp-Asp) domain-containing protein